VSDEALKRIGVVLALVLMASVLFVAFIWSRQGSSDSSDRSHSPTEIEKSFNPWNGSHIGLEKWIKSHMNNPDSYEHVETRYSDKGSYLLVTTTYRGTNEFGGIVTNTVTARCSLDGRVISVESMDP
jgi:hypothetical protein